MQASQAGADAEHATAPAGAPGSATNDAADLSSAARRLLEQGGETARAAADTAVALSALAEAELALARAAAPRALLFGVMALGLAMVAALYLLALMVALLHRFGLDWPIALAVATGLALFSAGLLALRAKQMWGLTRFTATRRQFSKLLSDPL